MVHVSPLARRLRDAPEGARREAMDFLRKRLARHARDGGAGSVRLLASAWIIEARA
jgi:hypothetical protein